MIVLRPLTVTAIFCPFRFLRIVKQRERERERERMKMKLRREKTYLRPLCLIFSSYVQVFAVPSAVKTLIVFYNFFIIL
jgi:hypothetical protein